MSLCYWGHFGQNIFIQVRTNTPEKVLVHFFRFFRSRHIRFVTSSGTFRTMNDTNGNIENSHAAANFATFELLVKFGIHTRTARYDKSIAVVVLVCSRLRQVSKPAIFEIDFETSAEIIITRKKAVTQLYQVPGMLYELRLKHVFQISAQKS